MLLVPKKPKLITRRSLLRAAGIAAPAIIMHPALAQFNGCPPGFCSPSAPVSACDPSWAGVTLLLPVDGANGSAGSPGMDDFSPSARGTAGVTGATISTTQSKFGGSSLFLNGSSRIIFATASQPPGLGLDGNPFTIEMFIYPTSVTGTQFLFGRWGPPGSVCYELFLAGTTLGFDLSIDGSAVIAVAQSASGTIVINTMQYVCVDYDGTAYRLYINGVMVAKTVASYTIYNPTAIVLAIGESSGGLLPYTGYIDEVRLSTVARYASDAGLIVPTVPFSLAACSHVTWDPATASNVTLSNGNLTTTSTGGTTDHGAHVPTVSGKTSGKYYFEVTLTTQAGGADTGIGVGTTASTYFGMGNSGAVVGLEVFTSGNVYSNGVNVAVLGTSLNTGFVVGVAIDLDNRRGWFRPTPASSWNGNAGFNPATNTGGQVIPAGTMIPFVTFNASGNVYTANFGSTAFAGAIPVGFTAGWPQ